LRQIIIPRFLRDERCGLDDELTKMWGVALACGLIIQAKKLIKISPCKQGVVVQCRAPVATKSIARLPHLLQLTAGVSIRGVPPVLQHVLALQYVAHAGLISGRAWRSHFAALVRYRAPGKRHQQKSRQHRHAPHRYLAGRDSHTVAIEMTVPD